MKNAKKLILAAMAISCLCSCGAKDETQDKNEEKENVITEQEIVSTDESDIQEKVEETKAVTGDIRDRVKDNTYVSYGRGVHQEGGFLIDFIKYPHYNSPSGKVEELKVPMPDGSNKHGLYLAAGSYIASLQNEDTEKRLEKIQTVTDIPVIFADPIFEEYWDMWDDDLNRMQGMTFERAEYSEIENVGIINGYETCRYTGKAYWYDDWDEAYSVGTFVGYCSILKGLYTPVYVTAISINRSQEPLSETELDNFALTCYSSLYELTEEEQDRIFGF